ncbi:MAG: selenocysteine-specific translation elongation factor, partial [Acidobacteriota bacterium]
MSESSGAIHPVMVGTAGHIDHGKTRLLEALTGVDCDRWAEEKARGITIDLGFTHLVEGGLQLGFVDVPGHEKFLHNALAGLGGIRLVLLVVAADEGVEPQTREHLAICRLLGIPQAIVALTKRDLVDADTLELARMEIEELLEPTPFADAEILPVSSITGEGLDVLRRTLIETAGAIAVDADPKDPLRLGIDRAFQLKGLGAIVTGTLVSGQVQAGQTIEILPRGIEARVRGTQVHGEDRPRAEAVERTALQLAGVGLDDLRRGEQLGTPGVFAPCRSLAVELSLLDDAPDPIGGWTPIRCFAGAAEVVGKVRALGEPIAPGDRGLAEIRLGQPLVMVRGDRFVIRRPSPATTLGGGHVLDPHWRRRRGREATDAARHLSNLDQALTLWVRETGERGATAEELAPRLGRRPTAVVAELDRLAADAKILRVQAKGKRFLDAAIFPRLAERAKSLIDAFFEANRLADGMPKAEFLSRLLPERARDLDTVYLRFFDHEKILVVDGDRIRPPGHEASSRLTGEEDALATRLLTAVEA